MYVNNNLNSISMVFTCSRLKISGLSFLFGETAGMFYEYKCTNCWFFLNDLRTAYVVVLFTSILKISQRGQGWDTIFTNITFKKELLLKRIESVKFFANYWHFWSKAPNNIFLPSGSCQSEEGWNIAVAQAGFYEEREGQM